MSRDHLRDGRPDLYDLGFRAQKLNMRQLKDDVDQMVRGLLAKHPPRGARLNASRPQQATGEQHGQED